MPRMAYALLFYPLITCTMLLGCAVGPDFHSPKPPSTTRYTPDPLPENTVKSTVQGGESQHLISGLKPPAQWWLFFQNNSLNCLIEKGLKNSPTIDAGQSALKQAKENLTAQIGASLFPAINAQAGAQRQKTSNASFGSSNPQSSIFNLFNTQVNVSYTLDIFGGARREIEALCALVDYQAFLLEGTKLTLASNIATTAITDASLRAQIEATEAIIKLQENLVQLIISQNQLGGASQLDILNQQTQLAQSRALLPPLFKSLKQTHNALAVLVGELPSEAELPSFLLENLQLPTELPISLPSLLVRQRPDLRASEALLHQASAQIGVATANLFPQVTITGFYGWQSLALDSLFSPSSNIWSIAAQIMQPLFQGGSLFAKRRSAIAAYEQAFAQYRQTVLQAFQNVADALQAIEMDAKTLKAQVAAEKAANETLALTKKQLDLGAVNSLSLLNAERQYQQAVINRIQAQAARLTDTVALFQALGGGWWGEQHS